MKKSFKTNPVTDLMSKELTDTRNKLKIKVIKATENTKGKKHIPEFLKVTKSIRAKLVISFLVPVVFVIILGVQAYSISSKAISDSFKKSTISLITSTGNYYDVVTQAMRLKAVELSTDTEITGYYNGKYAEDAVDYVKQGVNYLTEEQVFQKVKNKITTMLTLNKNVKNVMIFTDYGLPLTSSGSFKEESPYEIFKKSTEAASITKDTWLGYHPSIDSQLNLDTSIYAMAYVKQYINDKSKKSGYIILDLNMETITDALASMALPKGSKAYFITPDGREITASGTATENIFYGKDYYQKALAQKDSIWDSSITYKGKKQLFICSKVGDTGAAVAAMVPYSSITKQADKIKFVSFGIVILASLVAGCTGIAVTNGISKNISVIIKTVLKAADGDLTVTVKTKRKDEFSILSESINQMIGNMKGLITKASSVSDTVIISSMNVSNNSELLLAASKDISSTTGEIQQGIMQQAQDAEQCLREAEALNEQISLVYDNSIAIEKITVDTKKVVTDGIAEVDQLNEAAQASIKITGDTIKNIEELENETNAITEIIAVINEIASQTNLLSLNASIEAARAGIYGRGFSVVAEEIRNLSVKSVNSASEIEKIINRIYQKTRLSVQTVTQAGTISKTTEERLRNVIQLFHNINKMVDDLVNNMANITAGINDIDHSKDDTIRAITNISAVAEESSAASEEVDATAKEQLEAVTRLNEAIKALNNDSNELKAAIEMFKLN